MGYTLGAAEYMLKPIKRDQMSDLVRRLIGDETTGTVLVVEDDTDTRELLRRSLTADGWTIIEAEHGETGLARVAESPPDLIVLDLMMPVMDGFEFLIRLRRNEASRRIPVIVVSAKTLTQEERDRLNGDVDRIFAKGAYDQDKLLDDLCELVALRTGRPRTTCTTGAGGRS